MNEQDQARDLSETDISDMPDWEFKVMITVLEKRMADISDSLSKEIKENQSEMNAINEIKNTLGE